jgi:predicted DNA-binding protein with PD1-like motif
MKVFALRLKPNQDLKESLKDFVALNHIQSGFILTTVGSLKQAKIRFADQSTSKILHDKFEIVSLVGTLSTNGIHLHIAISDREGKTIGGHLDSGCIIYTTAEIVIGTSKEFTFTRTIDDETGFKELKIIPNSTQPPS